MVLSGPRRDGRDEDCNDSYANTFLGAPEPRDRSNEAFECLR